MKKIKVLHKMPNNSVHGGIQTFVREFYRYINKDEIQFDLLVGSERYAETDEFNKLPFNYVIIDEKDVFERNNKLEKILCNYDVFHLHTAYWMGNDMQKLAMDMKIQKVVVHSHGSGMYSGVNNYQEKMKVHNYFRQNITVKDATDFMACSKEAGKWLFGPQIPSEKIQIMHNAIDISRFKFDIRKRKNIREKLGIDKEIVIGSCGRFEKVKNLTFIIKVFKKIVEYFPETKLLLIGEGTEKEEIEKWILENNLENKTMIKQWKTQIEDYYMAMDIFLLPSYVEGLGLTLIEAQSAGLKCIASSHVPKEAKSTDLVSFLPLEEELWVEKILDNMKDYVRESQGSKLSKSGYDILVESKKLSNFYKGI